MASQEEESVIRICPWKNKEEFIIVYDWLFGENADRQTKEMAMDMLIVWKIRRQNLTAASIMSTIDILSVQLKDDPPETNRKSIRELQNLYANSFTRFLNNMSSILQGRKLRTMYDTAKELGIESFVVDIRHICAHGQVVPSIDVFRRTASYCMEWLHDFYWEYGLTHFNDVSAQDLRSKASIDFENQMKSLVKVYDITCEALYRKYKLVGEVDGNLDDGYFQLLEDYSAKFKHNKLTLILTNVTYEMTELTNQEITVRGHAQVYCDIICDCKYFFETASKFYAIDDEYGKRVPKAVTDFIGLHQNLFRSMAICGLIDMFYKALINICENDHETVARREGASFWCTKIVDGFLLLRNIKKVLKYRKEKNSKYSIDLSLLNTDAMSTDIRKIYKQMGVNCDGVLIFGDTVYRPWGVEFEDDFIRERLLKANKYTKDLIDKAIWLSKSEMIVNQQTLMEWISLYVDDFSTNMDFQSENGSTFAEIEKMCLDDDSDVNLQLPVGNNQRDGIRNCGAVKRYGIWSEVDDDVDWTTCPIGRLPWE